ncbi:site-specific DNA-methyltransferase [Polaribacter sp. R2A056_3_33]|nr:site-specific DNA-methyltransferase [Polaribacter sp. R2A056_3_33]
MEKEQYTTQNITASNKDLEVLQKHFSHCFDKNGDFDFDKFKKELSENEVNFSKESYAMDWLGKSYARLLASDNATTLLKEDAIFNAKEENRNSDNLLIKGDNLEVLKHLSNAYYEKIKMIYIDPPYNTGSDGFVYQDDRKFTVNEFKHLAGVDEDAAKKILNFVDSKSNSHSAWLTFMYPRLYIAKQLLKEDGVIFISIDDNEVSQLKLLMDEIFGEENFLGSFIVKSTPNARNYGHIGKMHEYVLMYAKNSDLAVTFELEVDKKFEYKDTQGGFNTHPLYNSDESFHYKNRPNLYYPFYINTSTKDKDGFMEISLEKKNEYSIEVYPPLSSKNKIQFVWRWGKDKAAENINIEIIGYQNQAGEYRVVRKMRHTTKIVRSMLLDKTFSGRHGTSEVETLFKAKIFSFPKPLELLKTLQKISVKDNDLILDFFAGSGTTGDAVMQLNAEDDGKRKFILAQLPEKIDKKTNKIAYDFVKNELKVSEPTIFDITKERLIRAAKKIKEENKDTKIDLGFKVFETTPIWEDYNLESDSFDEKLQLFDELQLTKEDIKALLITWKTNDGIALTDNLETIDLGKYTAYYFEDKMYLMDKGFTTDNLKTLLELIDTNKKINPASIIAFGYHFESKNLREISENIKSYANKKNIDIDFITRY